MFKKKKRESENNNIFVYWDNPDGSKGLPPYIELCLQTFWKNRGTAKLHVLNRFKAKDMLPGLRSDWNDLQIAQKVDYIKPRILHLYGGAFIDIDSICTDNLQNRLLSPLDTREAYGFGNEPNRPHVGCLGARKGSHLMKQWAMHQDLYFYPNTGWTHMGTDQLWKCAFHHYSQSPLDLVEPFDWTKAHLFDGIYSWERVRRNNPILIALFNKNFPDTLKVMTKDQLLTHKRFFGECIRNSI